jgi:hypothetical protein
MGEVLRGVTVLLVVLALSGSVAPAVTVTVQSGDGPSVALPRATSEEQRQFSTPQADPSTDQFPWLSPLFGPPESVASDAVLQDEDTIHLVQQFQRLPDQPGTVRVRRVYTVPERVVSLRTQIPAEATPFDRQGFGRINGTHLRWSETTQRPQVTYDLPVNETVDRTDPQAADGRYLYADTNDWSLFERPTTPTNWQRTGREPISLERTSATDGPGAAGQWMVFLGEHDLREREAYGQQFRLIVPAAANTSESPDAVLDALARSSDALRVGDRDEQVFAVAAPTDGVRWGVRGLQTGDTDMWVRDDERLDEADSAWLHEYVHTRQSFTLTSRTRWFEEASASYYAALLSLEQDAIDFEAFDDRMGIGSRPVYGRVVLANVSTWQRSPDYYKGALVAGQLDRRLRAASDREQTFQDVFRTMNGQQRPVTQLAFLEALAAGGGTATLDVGQTYTETPANVTTWNRSTHAAVFGQLPARVGYELPPVEESNGYRIDGPYRNTTADDAPVVLVTGERLTIGTVVTNVGGTAGEYNLSLRVNETVVNETSGRIGASQSTTVPLSHRFPTAGHYVVGIDGETVNVTVERPASARVVGLSVDRTQVRQGESVLLTATVHNSAPFPGEVTVVFTRDFEAVDRTRATLPANGTSFVTRQIGLPTGGTVSLGAGSVRPVEVSVEPVPARATGGGTETVAAIDSPPTAATERRTTTTRTRSTTAITDADGPGFGPAALAVALAVAVLIGRASD